MLVLKNNLDVDLEVQGQHDESHPDFRLARGQQPIVTPLKHGDEVCIFRHEPGVSYLIKEARQ